MTKVLVFESDAAFAQSLSSGLAAYGCEVTVVEDGEEGIEVAAKSKPDLILLTIELPRMNGFSVCNKLKRNGDLKSVPLVLLSGEATEETFEQHKRLRTKADAYVHKPISVDELVARLGGLVTLTEPSALAEVPHDDEALHDEDVFIDDEVIVDAEPEDISLDAEADQAFGNMMMGRAPSIPPPRKRATADEVEIEDLEIEVEAHAVGTSGGGVADVAVQERAIAEAVAVATSASIQELDSLKGIVASLNEQVEELKSGVAAAKASADAEADAKTQVAQKKDAEIELLQEELQAFRNKLESKESAGTAREFLDLREKLNRKDKEILDVRDDLTSKEKALVKANDEAIALGREKADLEDQVQAFTVGQSELEKQNRSLSSDKEQAQKRGDDFKSKSERLQTDLDAKNEEFRLSVESHENAIATQEAHEAALRADHHTELLRAADEAQQLKMQAVAEAIRATEEKAAGEQETALVLAAEAAKHELEQAVSARGVELRAEHDAKMAALHRANEESMRKLRGEHAHEQEQQKNEAEGRLAQRERELNAEKDRAMAELAAQKAAAEQERDEKISGLSAELGERTQERDTNRDAILQREGTIAQLEASMAALRAELAEQTTKLRVEEQLLSQARDKWQQDCLAIAAAQQSLSSALAQLEQMAQRPMP